MRRVLGIFWPEKISNDDLYNRSGVQHLSSRIKEQRWKLFGHILRRDDKIPAQTSMSEYFLPGMKYVGRPPTSLVTTLNQDLSTYQALLDSDDSDIVPSGVKNTLIPSSLQCKGDIDYLKALAQDRDLWNNMSTWINRAPLILET